MLPLFKRLKPEPLSVKFAGYDISELAQMTLAQLARVLTPAAAGNLARPAPAFSQEKRIAAQRIARTVLERVSTLRRPPVERP